MIVYQRDKHGKINKESALYVDSQNTVNSAVNELINGTDTARCLKENTESIEFLNEMDLNTALAITELYEMMVNLMSSMSDSKTFSLKRGGDNVAVGLPLMYANLIINGRKTFDNVPDKMKDDVRKVLEDMEMGHLAK